MVKRSVEQPAAIAGGSVGLVSQEEFDLMKKGPNKAGLAHESIIPLGSAEALLIIQGWETKSKEDQKAIEESESEIDKLRVSLVKRAFKRFGASSFNG